MIKTYENFITNLFTKNKKLPSEMYDLANTAYHLIKYYMNKVNNVIYVSFEKHVEKDTFLKRTDIGQNIGDLDPIISKIYYKKNVKQVVFSIWEYSKNVTELKEFLIYILRDFEFDLTTYNNGEYNFFIPIDKVQSVINEITIENLEEFLTEKKYNL